MFVSINGKPPHRTHQKTPRPHNFAPFFLKPPSGASTQITVAADLYYPFTNWTGEASGGDNPLGLMMDAPKTLQANFTETLAANDTPEWRMAEHGWTNQILSLGSDT